jgi:hypothetical protein
MERKVAKTQRRNLRFVQRTPKASISDGGSVEEYFVHALRLCGLASLR